MGEITKKYTNLIAVIALILFGGFMYLYGVSSSVQVPVATPIPQPFTGQEFLNAINEQRAKAGLPAYELSMTLCNNLSQRFYDITSPEAQGVAHYGFEKWASKVPVFDVITEIYVSPVPDTHPTLEDSIGSLMGSPGHRAAILSEEATHICTYAADYYGIAVMY